MSDRTGQARQELASEISDVRLLVNEVLPRIFDESVSVWLARAVEDLKAAEALLLASDRMIL